MISKKQFFFTIIKIHRYIGLLSALFIIALSVTGLLLQHTEKFNLDSHYVKNNALLDQYRIKPNSITSYQVEDHWVSYVGNDIYIDTQRINEEYSQVIGAIKTNFAYVILTVDELLLLSLNGDVMDRLSSSNGLPETMRLVGRSQTQELVFKGREFYWQVDNDFLSWKKIPATPIDWVKPKRAPIKTYESLLEQSRQRVITWERLIQDLHSGRLMGALGIYIMDIAAIAMLLLSFSGVYVFIKRPKRKAA